MHTDPVTPRPTKEDFSYSAAVVKENIQNIPNKKSVADLLFQYTPQYISTLPADIVQVHPTWVHCDLEPMWQKYNKFKLKFSCNDYFDDLIRP